MDLDTGAVIAAEMHAADQGDTATLPDTLAAATEHLAAVDATPTPEDLQSWSPTKVTIPATV